MEKHQLLEEPIGSMLTSPGPLDLSFASEIWERKAKHDLTSDIADQSMDIVWHVCPGDTPVQILHKLQEFMSETEHAPESFPDKIMQSKCLARAKEVATYVCGPRSENTWEIQ